jgi:UTP-glucose-1-phosphate uridylyltransferase
MFNCKKFTDKWIREYIYKQINSVSTFPEDLKVLKDVIVSDSLYMIKFIDTVITIYKDKHETSITVEILKEEVYKTYACYDSKTLNKDVRLNDVWNIITLYKD